MLEIENKEFLLSEEELNALKIVWETRKKNCYGGLSIAKEAMLYKALVFGAHFAKQCSKDFFYKKDFTIPTELSNLVVKEFEDFKNHFGEEYKLSTKSVSKKEIELQCNFFVGFAWFIDKTTGSQGSCISPTIYFKILRGEIIEHIEIKEVSTC